MRPVKCRFCPWMIRPQLLPAHIWKRHPEEWDRLVKRREQAQRDARDREESIKER